MVNKPPPGSPWCAWCLAAGAGDISTTATLSAECGHAVGGQICLAFTEICEFLASNQLVKLKPCLLCAEEQTCDGSFLHSSPLSPARWAPNICSLDLAFAPCSFIMQQTSASTAQDLMCSWFKKKRNPEKGASGGEEKRNWGSNTYVPHRFGNKHIFKWEVCWIALFYPSNAFLYSELLTFFPCFRFIRHVSSCQPPTACICVHLANSREKYFFPFSLSLSLSPMNVHFLAALKQILNSCCSYW